MAKKPKEQPKPIPAKDYREVREKTLKEAKDG
jgi:hypothetical protein